MPRAPRKPAPQDPVRRTAGTNRRRPKGSRDKLLASRTVTAELREPRAVDVKTLYAAIAWVFLLPACFITTHALAVGFGDSMGHSFWRSPAFWFFAMGLVIWLISFTALPRPVLLYVWAHEMTHAIFVILCGGKVRKFHYTAKGGYVLTDKNNVLISLAPYFFPLYTVILVPICLLLGAFVDLTMVLTLPGGFGFRPLWAVFLLIGLTWGFHLTFTLWMIGKDQPDLRINGVFFSATLIYLVNALLLALLLILAAPELSLAGFVRTWGNDAWGMFHALARVWGSLWHLATG